MKSRALAAMAPSAPFTRLDIERRELGPHDVALEIAFTGICHSDIHQVRQEWGPAIFPMVPGHEIAGCEGSWHESKKICDRRSDWRRSLY